MSEPDRGEASTGTRRQAERLLAARRPSSTPRDGRTATERQAAALLGRPADEDGDGQA